MTMKRLFIIFVLFMTVVSMSSYVFSGENVSAPGERILKIFLLDYEDAWNNKDWKSLMDFYHKDAKIMSGRGRLMVSKAKFTDAIKSKVERYGSMKFGKPKIKISGDEAKVSAIIIFSKRKRDVRYYYDMVRENDKWLIIKEEH